MASKSADGAVSPERAVSENFHHPYTPYDVQLQFMRVAYDALSRGEGQVGILESPTGTVCKSSLQSASLAGLSCGRGS